MFLKRFLANLNGINKRFFSFNMNFLSRQSKILTLAKSTFCTDKIQNTTIPNPKEYYLQYITSKPESFSCFSDVLALKREIEEDRESFKSLSDLLYFEGNLSLDELEKTIAVEFDCDANEICKKILFIGQNIALNETTPRLIHQLSTELWGKQFASDELLKILIAFNNSKFLKKSSFAKIKILKFFKRIPHLNPSEVVQVFSIMPSKDFSENDEKFKVLSYFNDNISLFNADEVGIISRGLTKGNFTFSHPKIYDTIINRVTEDIESIHSVPLQSICRALFKLTRTFKSELILNLQEKSIPYVPNISIPALINLSYLGSRVECINSSFWEIALRKYKENINNLPLFDILRILIQTIIYKTKDDELLKQIVEEIEKYKNDENQHDYFVYFLCNLTICNLYPKNLIDIVFSENFVSKKVLSSKGCGGLKLSWWILKFNLEIDKPEYLNYKLDTTKRIGLYKLCRYTLWNEKKKYTKLSKYFHKIGNYLKDLYGENAVVRTTCLPQHDVGFILRLNKYLEAQPIPESFFDNNPSYVRKPLDDSNYWIFLNLVAFNQYGIGGRIILEHHPTQCRQLKAVGYIPIMVPLQLYHNHVQNKTEDSFITELIQNSIKEEGILKI